MTQKEIAMKIECLRTELMTMAVMDEESVCLMFNTESKDEAIQLTMDKIDYYKKLL